MSFPLSSFDTADLPGADEKTGDSEIRTAGDWTEPKPKGSPAV